MSKSKQGSSITFKINKNAIYSKYWSTLNYLNKQIAQQPENAELYFKKGLINFNLKNFKESLNVFKESLSLNPELKDAEESIELLNNYNFFPKYWKN